MFFGSYDYQLDEKNRLVVPSKFRDELGTKAYLIKGYEGCVSIYKTEEFEMFIKRIKELPYEKKKARLHNRILLGSVEELKIDSQGRMQLPLKVINQYKINKEVTIIGVIDHLEIWDRETYKKYLEEHEEEFETNAEDLLSYEE